MILNQRIGFNRNSAAIGQHTKQMSMGTGDM